MHTYIRVGYTISRCTIVSVSVCRWILGFSFRLASDSPLQKPSLPIHAHEQILTEKISWKINLDTMCDCASSLTHNRCTYHLHKTHVNKTVKKKRTDTHTRSSEWIFLEYISTTSVAAQWKGEKTVASKYVQIGAHMCTQAEQKENKWKKIK